MWRNVRSVRSPFYSLKSSDSYLTVASIFIYRFSFVEMPSLRGYSAFIYNALASTPLIEYQPMVDGTGTLASCYIESTADQPFSIVLRDNAGMFTQGTAVHVDGIYVDNGLTGPGIATERTWYGKRVDHVNVRPFIFRRNPSGIQIK